MADIAIVHVDVYSKRMDRLTNEELVDSERQTQVQKYVWPANFPPTDDLTFDLLVPASLLTQILSNGEFQYVVN